LKFAQKCKFATIRYDYQWFAYLQWVQLLQI